MADTISITAIAAVLVLLVLLFRSLRGPQPLIRGPPRDSLIAGNLAQLFSPGGMEYHERFTKEYGNTLEIYGLFGVCACYRTDLFLTC